MTIQEKEKILKEYQSNKELVSRAERRIAELREEIITQMGSGQHGDWVVLISEQERESFNLKEAKSNISESVWSKISQFIKKASFKTVRVEKI